MWCYQIFENDGSIDFENYDLDISIRLRNIPGPGWEENAHITGREIFERLKSLKKYSLILTGELESVLAIYQAEIDD